MKLGESKSDEIVGKSLCHGCQTPMTPSKPIYSCTENCSFFLHKTCAESPAYIISHPMHPQHHLTLLEKPPYEGGKCECHCCGRQSWSNFTYHCETCDFDMDIFCANLEGQKLDHPCHKHALMPVPKRATFRCQACGETKEDASYICSSGCLYWIHESCASLPAIKKREDHDHPLSLAYCLSDDYIAYKLSCDVCSERLIKPYLWIYHCSLCRYVVHLKCINETEKECRRRHDTGIPEGSLLLPTDDFDGDLVETSDIEEDHLKQALVSTWDFFRCDFCNLDCNGDYFYLYECAFYIDAKCGLLPSRIHHEAHRHALVDRCRARHEYPRPGDGRRIVGTCNACGNSISSFYFDCDSGCNNYLLGYECALLPKTARHRWDKHLLILSFPPFSDHPERFYCEVCEEEIHPLRWQYRCRQCDQSFHPRCIPEASSSRNIKFGIDVDVDEHPHALVLVREADRFDSACHTCRKSLYGCRAFECAPCRFYMCHNCLVKIKTSAHYYSLIPRG